MAERFFEITPQSKRHAEYFRWFGHKELSCEKTASFLASHGIEAKRYLPMDDTLAIEATENDIKKFSTQFCKALDKNGLHKFRTNSKVAKEWSRVKVSHGLFTIPKPFVPFFFEKAYGNFRTSLFHIGNKVYCSLTGNSTVDCPKGFIEMKGSDFHRVIEGDQNEEGKN